MAAPHQPQPCPTPGRGTLAATYPSAVTLGRISCKRWSCPTCGPRNAHKLQKRLENVNCNRFLTLTYRMTPGETQEAATVAVKLAWTKMRKRLERMSGSSKISYVLVIEWTQRGSPHLHVLLNSPFLRQRAVSAAWRSLTGSPIVDIRRVKSKSSVAKYLTSYLTKSSVPIKSCHKYSATQGFLPPLPPREYDANDERPTWSYDATAPWVLASQMLEAGWIVEPFGPDALLCIPPAAESITHVATNAAQGWGSS